MTKRINITLPEETLERIDTTVSRGERSKLIDHAVRTYLDTLSRSKLREALTEGATVRSKENLQLAGEWLPLENEVWQ